MVNGKLFSHSKNQKSGRLSLKTVKLQPRANYVHLLTDVPLLIEE